MGVAGQQHVAKLIELARSMQGRLSLEEALRVIADGSAEMLAIKRVSVRLLDATRTELVAVARAGAPMHSTPVSFKCGEGLVGWIVEHAQPILSDDAEADPRFEGRPGKKGAIGAFLGVPIVVGNSCIGVISAVGGERRFTAADQDILVLIAAISAPHVEIARLSRLSTTDPLTGSLNRRGLDQSFPEVTAPAGGGRGVLSVAMVDLDNFKAVNDSRGHAVGDEVLKHVTSLLVQCVRAGDAVVRVGGEEFLLVLPEVALLIAERVAGRARAAIEASPTPVPTGDVQLTVSIGVAQRAEGETRDGVIARADAALYRAKANGRNRVELDL